MGGASARTVGKLRINGVVSEDVVLQVVTGNGWAQALDAADWQDGEILALGTSPFGDVARVFLLLEWQDHSLQPGPRASTTGLDRN